METAKKYKWALGGLSIMILLNALIIITLWVNRPGDRGRRVRAPEERREAVHRYMSRELDLSDEQQETMAELRRAHFAEARNLRDELEASRRAYFDYIMHTETSDTAVRDSLLAKLTDQYLAVERSMYTHMSEMKAVLDSSQQRKFSRLMKDMLMRNQREENSMRPMRDH